MSFNLADKPDLFPLSLRLNRARRAIRKVRRVIFQLWPVHRRSSTALLLCWELLTVRRRPVARKPQDEALDYVKVHPVEGEAQLQVLICEGCRPWHKVLEIGCGTLVAGYPVIQYLQRARYTGIDPNSWLIEAALAHDEIRSAVCKKQAHFLFNDTFDASTHIKSVDFILSHSVLNHCSLEQLKLFLSQANKVLKRGGKIAASIRFAEGNAYGYAPTKRSDADFTEWQYPFTSAFKRETVKRLSEEAGFQFMPAPHYTRFLVHTRPEACQDWVVFERI